MGRIIGIDFGTKRIGIAVTDPLQIIVTPLAVVSANEGVAYIETYLKSEPVDCIVCGLPGETYADTRRALEVFINRLKKVIPGVPVVLHDEHLTSRKASEVIRDSGLRKMKRRDKSLVDQVSAVLILQDYLGHLRDIQTS